MDFDPHTLHQILERIRQQMRCPQCGERVPMDFGSVRLTGDDFMLLQVRCDTCDAYIVLHAALREKEAKKSEEEVTVGKDKVMNASSTLCLGDDEIKVLRTAVEQHGGSFEKLFEKSKES